MDLIHIKRGRPKGAKTKSPTPGKKRAREFMEYQMDNDLKPTKAAEAIAKKHGVETYQIFKDRKRHSETICREEADAANQAKRDYEEMLSAMIGPPLPDDFAARFVWGVNAAVKGQTI